MMNEIEITRKAALWWPRWVNAIFRNLTRNFFYIYKKNKNNVLIDEKKIITYFLFGRNGPLPISYSQIKFEIKFTLDEMAHLLKVKMRKSLWPKWVHSSWGALFIHFILCLQ